MSMKAPVVCGVAGIIISLLLVAVLVKVRTICAKRRTFCKDWFQIGRLGSDFIITFNIKCAMSVKDFFPLCKNKKTYFKHTKTTIGKRALISETDRF